MNLLIKGLAKTPARLRCLFLSGWVVFFLAACSGVEVHGVNIQTAATGTELEAKQVVALVYGQAPLAEIDKLLYAGGDLTRAIRRVHGRYSQLKPYFEQGQIGHAANGFVALRLEGDDQLRDLVRQENNDRAFLYTQTSVAVGHGGDNLNSWRPYASHRFGKEWIAQSPKGWWVQDEAGGWQPR